MGSYSRRCYAFSQYKKRIAAQSRINKVALAEKAEVEAKHQVELQNLREFSLQESPLAQALGAQEIISNYVNSIREVYECDTLNHFYRGQK